MKRYASHFLFLPGMAIWKQYVVEIGEGQCVSRIFPLTEEVENTEWLPGVIALLTEGETDYPHFDTCCNILTAIPPVIEEEIALFDSLVCFPLILLQCSLARNSAQTAVAIATFNDS